MVATRINKEKIILGYAILSMLILVLAEHSSLISLPPALAVALCVIAYVLIAGRIFLAAVRSLIKTKRLNEQSLMIIATLGAFALGDYAETLAVMIFYVIGSMFEEYAQGRSRNEITSLIKLKPQSVRVIENGIETTLKPRKVKIGQVIRVLKGEMVALDGILLNDTAALDTSALTGESEPRAYVKGDEVSSGCINCGSVIELRVNCDYKNSSVTRLLNLIEDAAANKSRPEALIRRFAFWYTPCVVTGAVLLALIPLFIRDSLWSDWLTRALVFLVVSCPCALVLSVPLSFFGGMGAVSKLGVMVKGTVFIENLARLKALAFDKTGTVTSGNFSVDNVIAAGPFSQEEILQTAASLEKMSSHPLARAIITEAHKRGLEIAAVTSPSEKEGFGISGVLEGKKISAGKYKFACAQTGKELLRNEAAGTEIYVTKGSELMGIISLTDEPKREAAAAFAELSRLGIKTCLISGDKRSAAEAVARKLGIAQCLSEQLPEDKLESFKQFKRENGMCGFVGDGINDAPVLACADVGIAMGQFGSQAAVEASDVVVMTDDLSKIPRAVALSRRTYNLAMQNLYFSVLVKLAILILGALGFANIWLAIFGDVGVLILAVLNAMRSLSFVKVKEYTALKDRA